MKFRTYVGYCGPRFMSVFNLISAEPIESSVEPDLDLFIKPLNEFGLFVDFKWSVLDCYLGQHKCMYF